MNTARKIVLPAMALGLAMLALTIWMTSRQVPREKVFSGKHPWIDRTVELSGYRELDALRQLDAFWYLDIAEHGWHLDQGQSNVVFMPLFPMTIRAISTLIGGQTALAGQIVATVGMLLAAAMFALLTKALTGEASWGIIGACLLFFHPMAIFLHVVYPEGLFIAGLCGLLLLTQKPDSRQNAWLTGLLSFLLAATRPQGFFIPLALIGVDLIQSLYNRSLKIRYASCASMLGFLIFVGLHALWLHAATGDPWSFWTRRVYWDANASWLHVPRLLLPIFTRMELLPRILLYATLFGAWLLWRRGWRDAALIAALLVVLPLQKGNLGDLSRYSLLAVFALVPILQRLRSEWRMATIGSLATLQGFFLARWLDGGWVG